MISRRRYIQLLAGSAALTTPGILHAQDGFPSRAIRLVVGFPAGQSLDIGARAMSAKMTEDLGQPVVVDNRPGAAGILAHEAVKGAAPDGYTLQMASTASLAINPGLYRNLPYDVMRDFTPIVLINTSQMFLAAANDVPVRSVQEMIAFAKARPGQVSYGSGGNGTTAHIAMEMLKRDAGIDMVHVPYRGSPAMVTDLIAGRIQFAFDSSSSILPHIQGGRVRAIGVSSKERSPQAPEVPSIAESGFPDFLALTWAALIGPAGMPAPIVERLNAAVNRALRQPDVIAHYTTLSSTIMGGTAGELRSFMESELRRWADAVRASGAQVE